MTHSNYGPGQPEHQPEHQPAPQAPPLPPEAFSHPGVHHPDVYHPDVYLPHLYPPPPRKSGPGKKIIAGLTLAAVAAGGAVAAYAYTVLASSGIQPERVLPATTVAFAKLDLDPAAGQKIAAYRLSTKFPAVSKGAADLDGARDSILSEFFDKQSELDYATEIKPWLGDRIAVAAVPNPASATGLDPVLVVAYTDEAKMKAAFSKAVRPEHDFGYVTVEGYALISDSQPHAEAVLAGVRRGTLAEAEVYRADLKALNGDQLAVGWADLEATVAALKARDRPELSTPFGSLTNLDTVAAKGRVIVGAHASSDYLEISAIVRQQGASGGPRLAGKPVNGTLAKLDAADTSAALEITGLGESFTQAWAGASTAMGLGGELEDFAEENGLRLPEDLMALFGSDATLSVRLPQGADGDPEIAAQVTTDDGDRAMELLDTVGLPFGFPPDSLRTQATADGYLLSTSDRYDPRAPTGARTLGADPAYQKAVPDRADAGLIGYLNLGRILDSDRHASAKEKADWKHVGSLGLSVVPTPDGSRINFRFTTR